MHFHLQLQIILKWNFANVICVILNVIEIIWRTMAPAAPPAEPDSPEMQTAIGDKTAFFTPNATLES